MKRIRYISEFVHPMTSEQLDELTRVSARNNMRDGITGMLVASGNLFFQLIEGPDEAIDALFAKIARDERHTNVMALGTESGDLKRLCPNWGMNRADLDSDDDVRLEPIRAILHAVSQQQRILTDLTETLERAMWRELIQAENSTVVDG